MHPILPVNQEKRRLVKHNAPECSSDFEQVPAPTPLSIERLVRTEES